MPWFSALVAPVVGGLISSIFAPKPPPPPPTLSYGQASEQAETVLGPIFDRILNETLADVDHHNISRGFFGQAPGAALSRSTAADVEGQRVSAIGNLAHQMVGQSQQAANQAAALAQNQWAQQQQGFFGGAAMGLDWYNMMSNLTGTLPFTTNLTQPATNAMTNIGMSAALDSLGSNVTPSSYTPSPVTTSFGSGLVGSNFTSLGDVWRRGY